MGAGVVGYADTMGGENRCHARNSFNERCRVEGEHQEITNSGGQRALVHETLHSIWTVPVSGLIVKRN